MAKQSLVARQQKRLALTAEQLHPCLALGAQLKKEGNYQALDKLPANALPVRLRHRCWQCGRPRSYMKLFGTCRLCFKKLVAAGHIPGITKASC